MSAPEKRAAVVAAVLAAGGRRGWTYVSTVARVLDVTEDTARVAIWGLAMAGTLECAPPVVFKNMAAAERSYRVSREHLAERRRLEANP